ncbi:hypothetical protein ScPMuIL_017500, partial [Solemya velum]
HLSLPVNNKTSGTILGRSSYTAGRSPIHILQWRPQSQANDPGKPKVNSKVKVNTIHNDRETVFCERNFVG